MGPAPSRAIITVEVVFDWLKRRRPPGQEKPGETAPETGPVWHVYLDAGTVVAEDGRSGTRRAPLAGADRVRVVPLTGGNHHAGAQSGGWQVTLASAEGDVLLGAPLRDWQTARELARLICEKTELPLDELTQRMFSRVGQYIR